MWRLFFTFLPAFSASNYSYLFIYNIIIPNGLYSNTLYIFSFYGDIDPLYIFIMDILIYYILYVVMTTHVTFCISCIFMAILLFVFRTGTCIFAITCWDLSLYCTDEWWVLPHWSSLLHLWDGYNVFFPSCYPSDLTH